MDEDASDTFAKAQRLDSPLNETPVLHSISTQHKNATYRQLIRSNVQEVYDVRTLYPTFDDSNKLKTPQASAMSPSGPKLQHRHQMSIPRAQECDTGPPAQVCQADLQEKQKEIEREMRVYQQQFDHVAKALALETPHQVQERKKRKEERLERQEKRCKAVEMRLQHHLERLEEREERRTRILARHYRNSSPSSDCESQSELAEKH